MISIIMIVYDVEEYVAKSIQSVLSQTEKDIELIIVVGHGHDRSEEICERFAKNDKRIKLIACEARGIADARNRGLAAAKGDYIGFVDSDDHVESEMFESMLSNLQKYDADIAVCGRFYEYVNKTLSDTPSEPVVMTGSEAIAVTLGHDGFFLHLWDKLFKREIFDGVSFRTDITVEDRIVTDRLLSKATRVVYDPTPMYHFRERSGSNSKRRGMVRNNVEANLLMEEFIKSRHPELKSKCDLFMLYEFITAVQNELTSDEPCKDDIMEYRAKIRLLLSECRGTSSRSIKLKAALALYAPTILKLYTKRRQQNVSDELERFP